MNHDNTASLFKEAPQLSPIDERLVESYRDIGRSLDDLPYTEDFEKLVDAQRAIADHRSKAEIFHRLLNLRKAGRMPRVGHSAALPLTLCETEIERLYDLIAFSVGTVGQRDRLPYTREFEQLVVQFNSDTGRQLSKHDVWRLVARVAK